MYMTIHMYMCVYIYILYIVHVLSLYVSRCMLFTRVYICVLQGHVKPLSQQVLTVKYLPFGPKKFHTSFQIQVSLLSFVAATESFVLQIS